MEIKELISHFVIEALALTSIATFVLLIILAALIRLVKSRRRRLTPETKRP
jgi:hypothetical protein